MKGPANEAAKAADLPGGLSTTAEEFRRLERRRRAEGLQGREIDRYHTLFAQLSDVLSSTERRRRVNLRQFLRVPFDMQVVIAAGNEERHVPCRDFGGGGCALAYDAALRDGDELVLEAAIIGGERVPFGCRAAVAWARDGAIGLRFALDQPEARDIVDAIFYRVLGVFLEGGGDGADAGRVTSAPARAGAKGAPPPQGSSPEAPTSRA